MLKTIPLLTICMTLALACAFSTLGADKLCAIEITEEQLQQIPPEHRARALEQIRKMNARQGNQTKPPEEKKPEEKKDEKKKPDEEKKKEEDKEDVVTRPTEPPTPADPEELKVAVGADGKVQFSFLGQPWADVLQWYADVAGNSFDWQELPAGFVNLTTQRKYTLDETRDLLNRLLLARGFTMLLQGDVLTVVKIDKIDPSLIRRVEADDLEDFLPHDFLRVRFQLPPGMDPAKTAEDVKVLKSPHGKVLPLLQSRRLLVIDAVANLRDIRDLLYAEQMATDAVLKPIEFHLLHRRADFVADQIMVVLGLDPQSRKTPQELQLEQKKMQMMQKMQQKGKDITKLLSKDGPQVYIAVNMRQNSLLINAPPELMGTIERTIQMFDVPDGGGEKSVAGELSMETYKTVTASPGKVIEALQEIGSLDPRTQLSSDGKSKSVYAFATPADHAKIQKMIGKLDGSGRTLTVFWLRRLRAEQVAGTVMALLVGEKKEKKKQRSPWSWRYNIEEEEEEKPAGFNAMADVDNNRLLLWANADELAEVRNLLEQLGEIPSRNSQNPSKVRILEARDAEATARLLERLEATWSGSNQLRLHLPKKEENTDKPAESPAPDTQATKKDTLTRNRTPSRHRLSFAALETEAPKEAAPEESPDQATASPALDVIVMPDGRIVLKGDDPGALDELERLVSELAPPKTEFEVFELRNSRASLVVLNLEEYFEEELAGATEARFNIWGDQVGTKKKDVGSLTLSKSPTLRFIWDIDTNTIVAQNASPSQLRVIRQLIEIYDRPVDDDSVLSRRTEAIKIRYSRATDIATALKEVYRDLLSSKDKEFQGKDGQGKSRTETHYRFFGSGSSDSKRKKTSPVKIAFEGALSIGVDEISNTLIISAQEDVWDNVRGIVEALDESAKPNTVVHVHEVRTLVSPDTIQKALAKALSEPWPGGKPAEQGSKNAGKKNGDDPEKSATQNKKKRK